MENERGMCRIPLFDKVENVNEDKIVFEHLRPDQATMNVCELPSIEKEIRYLHAAAGFLTKKHS